MRVPEAGQFVVDWCRFLTDVYAAAPQRVNAAFFATTLMPEEAKQLTDAGALVFKDKNTGVATLSFIGLLNGYIVRRFGAGQPRIAVEYNALTQLATKFFVYLPGFDEDVNCSQLDCTASCLSVEDYLKDFDGKDETPTADPVS